MIRHIVMWRVSGDTEGERLANARTVRHAYERMRGRVPGMTRLEVGLDVSRVDYACDMVLVTEFDDERALAAYADDAEHRRARQAVAGLRIERYQVDYVMANEHHCETPS